MRFVFNCAQNSKRQHKPQKTKGPDIKCRGKGQMDTFDCNGWLRVWACEDTMGIFVWIHHMHKHISYCCINIPKDVQKYVLDNLQLRVPQVSRFKYKFDILNLMTFPLALERDSQNPPASQFHSEVDL